MNAERRGGLPRDSDDAETDAGMDVGGGLAFTDTVTGLSSGDTTPRAAAATESKCESAATVCTRS